MRLAVALGAVVIVALLPDCTPVQTVGITRVAHIRQPWLHHCQEFPDVAAANREALALGKKGWELVSATPRGTGVMLCFKQPYQE